ncbi:hypothetical protein BCR44DRAFT_47697 [Catenaria anguillulae PL171]|uniref:Uncharacterized protein n=1 Tax=Catenaria anguillulae PL171 TaxID=765915 RepID=A0A1Y2HPX7_9FUNG|nr:hypothetical protein BCR44DRAFT_47697 [Catenaria anguillulae PL171]
MVQGHVAPWILADGPVYGRRPTFKSADSRTTATSVHVTASGSSSAPTQTSTVTPMPTATPELRSPNPCLSSTSLERLERCQEKLLVRSLTPEQHAAMRAPPSGAWQQAVVNLMKDGCQGQVPQELQDDVQIVEVQDQDVGKTFCVLTEKWTLNGSWVKGFGTVAVPKDVDARQKVHFAAPHTGFDSFTNVQSAAVFARTSTGRSLLIATRHRHALNQLATCVRTPEKNVTDPVASNDEPMSLAGIVIFDHFKQQQQHWIQFHGHASAKCATDSAFFSPGLHPSTRIPGSHEVFTRLEAENAFLVRVMANIQALWKDQGVTRTLNATWALTTKECNLSGGPNVLGRLVNGVPQDAVCQTDEGVQLDLNQVKGDFVHIEQTYASRTRFADWAKAIDESVN